jgi:hypothetical protein
MDDQQMEEDRLRSQMVEGQAVTSRSRMIFSQWIAGRPVECWTLVHDTNGARYGHN